MNRLLSLTLALAPCLAAAEGPEFSRSAFFFTFEYGPGAYEFSEAHLADQVGAENAAIFMSEFARPYSHSGSLRLAFNLFGHFSLGGVLSGSGWNLETPQRGGGGFVTGVLAWHPLQLVAEFRSVDLSFFGGAGYGIVGRERGADGLVLSAGATLDYYFSPGFFLGGFFRYMQPRYDKFYVNYDARDVEGNTLPLPNGSGGSFWMAGVTLGFRVPL